MTPEEILRPFIRRFEIPDSLVRLLYLSIEKEIAQGYPSLRENEGYHRPDPELRLAQGLKLIFERLPTIYDAQDGKLHATIQQLGNFQVEEFDRLSVPVEWHQYHHLRKESNDDLRNVKQQLAKAEHFAAVCHTDFKQEARATAKEWKDTLRDSERMLKELREPDVQPYFTYFWSIVLNFNVSFDLPHRNEHTHILGAPGTGKTELIKRLAYQDIQSGASVIVLAPKDDLCETLAKIPTDRTIWLSEWSQVGLNLRDLDISLIVYVFEALLESEPTWKQRAFLTKYVPEIHSLRDFRTMKVEPIYRETVEQIGPRLDLLPPVIDQILSRPTSIDILDVMDNGKVLILDVQHLGNGAAFIGRLFIALIEESIKRRKTKHPCYVYIDEAPVFITEYMVRILDRARSANVGLTLAHQDLEALSPKLRSSLHNAALKFCGRVQAEDAAAMGKQMQIDPKVLQNLPRLTFMFSGMRVPFTVQVTPGEVNQIATEQRRPFHADHTNRVPAKVGKEDSEDARQW